MANEAKEVKRARATIWMGMQIGKELAVPVAKAIEECRWTISDALGWGLSKWLEEHQELELASMVLDGRGVVPRYPLRHK